MRRDFLLMGLLLAGIAGVAAWAVVGDYMQRDARLRRTQLETPTPMTATQRPPPVLASTKPAWSAPTSAPRPRAIPTPASRPLPAVDTSRANARPKPRVYQRPPVPAAPITREVAREALAFVGTDPAAEEVWNRAINDPDMPPNVRKDLIEDLNEDGFPDPRNITPDDLPLIVNRLALIERLGPEAMDGVNVAAFQEAYKDLVNMYNRVAGQ